MARDDYEPQMVSMSAEEPAARKRGARARADEFKLGPRTGAQLVDLGIEVLLSRFLLCVGISVLMWLPIRMGMPFILRMAPQAAFDQENFVGYLAALGAYTVAAKFIELVVTMTVTILAYNALVGRNLGAWEALKRTLSRTLAMLGLFMLQFLIVVVGGYLLLVLGFMCPPLILGAVAYWLYFSWKLSVAPGVLILEDAGVGAAISRSFRLTEGSFLRWLWLTCIVFCLTVGFGAGMQLSDNQPLRDALLEASSISPVLFDTSFVFISSVFAGLSTVLWAVASTTFYIDTRIRREGLDLRMRLQRRVRAHSLEPAT